MSATGATGLKTGAGSSWNLLCEPATRGEHNKLKHRVTYALIAPFYRQHSQTQRHGRLFLTDMGFRPAILQSWALFPACGTFHCDMQHCLIVKGTELFTAVSRRSESRMYGLLIPSTAHIPPGQSVFWWGKAAVITVILSVSYPDHELCVKCWSEAPGQPSFGLCSTLAQWGSSPWLGIPSALDNTDT